MIDWNRIAELRDEIGADDFGEVVEIFLEEVDDKIAELRDLTDQSDLESVMHFLKGSALNLGFSAFSDLCQQGETAARMGDGENIDLTAVIACYDVSKAEFLSALNKLDAA